MNTNKLPGYLRMYGHTQSEIAASFDIFVQSFNRKLKSWDKNLSLGELIRIAAMNGHHVSIVDEKGREVVTFDLDDLKD